MIDDVDAEDRTMQASFGDVGTDAYMGLAGIALMLLIIMIIIAANQGIRAERAESAHTSALEALRAEEEAKKAAEEREAEAEKAAEESDAAAADARRREKAAKARASTAQRAAEQVLGKELSYEDLDDIANLPKLKERLKQAEAMNKTFASQVTQMATDMRTSQIDAERARRDAEQSKQREAAALDKYTQCRNESTTQGGDPEGNLVSAGYRIWIHQNGREAVITDPEVKAGYFQKRYTCKRDEERVPASTGGGGAFRDGGVIGK